ncbi:lanthionine synthetase C family protein [Hyalangium rubrum]|uniref:Lanthionine synthetase C family protein n=1 Tax=Hyalangium rubrum TaxID=3103134 RepID=A0ABU5H654_9BACT|nr:lanthionine synthetase C family protein [Hyalangium sp. s54d21]MDY7228736.1 lanthionine synthetase C family protein [Hyalangium sp. s54d21]
MAEQARQAVVEIATALASSPAPEPREDDPTLASGAAGQAVLFAALAAVLPELGHAERAVALLDRAFDGIGAGGFGPELYAGYTGVGWAAEFLRGRLLASDEDHGADVDEALDEVLSASPPPGAHDLVRGLVGLGVYARERLPAPAARRTLERIVRHLGAMARHEGPGCCWPAEDARVADVGVAHGTAGVVAFLAACWREGVSEARPLMDGAVSWLLAHRLPLDGETRFPAFVALRADGPPPKPTRSAWCYGDPGVALALLSAARATGDVSWEREALEAARAAARRPMGHTQVVDAGLCHGAAGLGHLFHRLYQATGEDTFAHAARGWFTRTLAMRKPGEGIAGYLAFAPTHGSWHADPGLLTGAAGVALALLSAAWPIPSSWDRMLLADLPLVAS